jgi:hypothetical protein
MTRWKMLNPKNRQPIWSLKKRSSSTPGLLNAVLLNAVLLSVVLLSGGAGCGSNPKPSQQNTATSTTQLDDVTVTLEVTPNPARLSDEPTLTLIVNAPQDHAIELPIFVEQLGDFLVSDFHAALPQTNSGRQIQKQVYHLEPTYSGHLEIEPLSIGFKNAAGEKKTIETEPLEIEILSMVESSEPSLEDLEAMEEPVELPESFAWQAAALGLLIIAVLVTLVVIFWRRKSKVAATPQKKLTPHEQAIEELEQLLASGMAEANVKQFFVVLTGIVRRFIEATTNVRAPEQTTEEFLAEIARHHHFPSDKKERLQAFLESADLIKYAAFQPRQDDIDEAVSRARQFISPPNPSDSNAFQT